MTETKWTPGPWNIRHEMPYYLITDVNNCLLSQVCPTYDDKSLYNAQLYAAAPDMYAALKIVSGMDLHHEVLAIVDAAMRKARGE